jgi:hypothetical protein
VLGYEGADNGEAGYTSTNGSTTEPAKRRMKHSAMRWLELACPA